MILFSYPTPSRCYPIQVDRIQYACKDAKPQHHPLKAELIVGWDNSQFVTRIEGVSWLNMSISLALIETGVNAKMRNDRRVKLSR